MEPAKYNFIFGGIFGASSHQKAPNFSQSPQAGQRSSPGIPTFTRHVSVSSNFKFDQGQKTETSSPLSPGALPLPSYGHGSTSHCSTQSTAMKDGPRRPTAKLSLPLRTGSEPPLGRRRMLPVPVSIDLPQQQYTPSPSSAHSVQFSPEDQVHRRYEEMLKKSGQLTLDPGGPTISCQREDIQLECELGQGICGVVSRARLKQCGRQMAVKVMRRTGNNAEENKRVIMDLEVVTKCHDCRHIVRCFGVFIFPSEVWVCMELMATCLDRLMRHAGALPERILGKIVVPILKALHYLKERHNIIHRDVKPSNMLLSESGRVKLCDFGISGLLEDSRAKTRTAGCTAYLSPERITLAAPYDIRSDVWSLGISLVELATGRHPLADCATEMEMLTRIVDEPPPQLPLTGFTDHFREFVARCLTKDVSLRPKYQRLLGHDFIKYHEQTQTDLADWLAEVRIRCPGLASPSGSTGGGSSSGSSGAGSAPE
ncbi:hypothetical protein BOX15_Mlig021628g3 [Macrostomum lignano]|uniref:mitogen-activated protein kinase kinase n=1 Tax=Macrostomum lignano TaxID=282301 RepID=A0A267FNG0_9PLAT|nr:hypothetical protein BOX15_Mlig021628g3 [Macrostomum lignano]